MRDLLALLLVLPHQEVPGHRGQLEVVHHRRQPHRRLREAANSISARPLSEAWRWTPDHRRSLAVCNTSCVMVAN
jgi:hypothetical protein